VAVPSLDPRVRVPEAVSMAKPKLAVPFRHAVTAPVTSATMNCLDATCAVGTVASASSLLGAQPLTVFSCQSLVTMRTVSSPATTALVTNTVNPACVMLSLVREAGRTERSFVLTDSNLTSILFVIKSPSY
jgi:hypothetical protein